MERVNQIWSNPDYQKYLQMIGEYEADRRFCRHGMSHMLDVARIMLILKYQEHCDINEELIYATALLHDLGRALQYRDGIGHEVAGGKIAPAILKDSGYNDKEIEMIVNAISTHRNNGMDIEASAEVSGLEELLYRADKLSRSCFACEVKEECYWSEEKKNLQIKI